MGKIGPSPTPAVEKPKIVRTIGAVEHTLYEVSAELITVLEREPLFEKLFEGVSDYKDRLVECLSRERSETERLGLARRLMENLWRANMAGGPYLVPNLLPEFETSRLFYPRYRDHTVHQLRVLLLGVYLYTRNRTIRDAVRVEVRQWAGQDAGESRIDELFLRAWLVVATFHDQGYVFETDLPEPERQRQLGRVFDQLNAFLKPRCTATWTRTSIFD